MKFGRAPAINMILIIYSLESPLFQYQVVHNMSALQYFLKSQKFVNELNLMGVPVSRYGTIGFQQGHHRIWVGCNGIGIRISMDIWTVSAPKNSGSTDPPNICLPRVVVYLQDTLKLRSVDIVYRHCFP